MNRQLELDTNFYATSDSEGGFRSGEIFHIERNQQGGSGSVNTPIARYFVTRPQVGAEGVHRHWRVDCFVSRHRLAPREDWLAERLIKALLQSALIAEPIWLSWHRLAKTSGKAFGELFDLD